MGSFFEAAGLNPLVFDMFLFCFQLFSFLLVGFIGVYANSKRQKIHLLSNRLIKLKKQLYILLINRFYIDLVYERWSKTPFKLSSKS